MAGLTGKPKRRSQQERKAAEWFRMVTYDRAGGLSQVSYTYEWPMDAHHTIPQQTLRREAPALQWDPDGAILLTRAEHEAHHRRSAPISFDALPEYVTEWAAEHDLTVLLERYHPRA